MNTFLLPYNSASKSAKILASALGIQRININRSTPRKATRNIINWGNTGLSLPPEGLGATGKVWNHPDDLRVASNKLECLERLAGAGVTVPEFTTDMAQASMWLEDDREVVERHILNGSSGRGIVIVNSTDQLSQCPLYTLYVKKKEEYRVHIIDGVVVDVQRKARKLDVDSTLVNWKVRNLEGGFIFARQNIDTPVDVIGQALSAYDALDLDFCAIDVIYNEKQKRAYVLEVNTAPGLEGTTLDTYVNGLTALMNNDAQRPFDVNTDANQDFPEETGPAPVPVPQLPTSNSPQWVAQPLQWVHVDETNEDDDTEQEYYDGEE